MIKYIVATCKKLLPFFFEIFLKIFIILLAIFSICGFIGCWIYFLQGDINLILTIIFSLMFLFFAFTLSIVILSFFKTKIGLPKKVTLENAIENGDIELVKHFLEKTTVYSTRINKSNILNIAAKNGHLEIVKYFIQKGFDINEKNSDGRIVLMHACLNGHTEVVKYLVERGANINIKDNEGNSALIYSIQSGHLEIVQYLVEKSANINDYNNSGNSPLKEALLCGCDDIAKYLIENGADKKHLSIIDYAQIGDFENIKKLINSGVDINIEDSDDGFTALSIAAAYGYLDIVEYLVGQGANINIKNINDNTALELAKENEHIEIVEYLQSVGA